MNFFCSYTGWDKPVGVLFLLQMGYTVFGGFFLFLLLNDTSTDYIFSSCEYS